MENVVIIGGSSSIGKDISSIFRDASMRVFTTYTSNIPNDELDLIDAFKLDLVTNESIKTFTENLKNKVKKIDIVIFLSGFLLGKQLAQYKLSDIDNVMAVNFSGQAKLIHEMLPLFSPHSRLLLFSSISAQRGSFDPVYAASKGALLSFVKSLMFELPSGARINAIAPGLIEHSAMYEDMAPEIRKRHKNQIPSQQLLNSKDLAKILFDLCQEHWKHLNGACIDLNGGEYVR